MPAALAQLHTGPERALSSTGPRSWPGGRAGSEGRRQAHFRSEPIRVPGFCRGLEPVPAAPRLPPEPDRSHGCHVSVRPLSAPDREGTVGVCFSARQKPLPRGAGCGSRHHGLGDRTAAWHSGAAPGPSRRSCARAPRRPALGDPAARGWAGARTSPPGATRGALRPSASPPALHGSLRPPCNCCPAGRRSRVPWTLFRATLSCGLGRAVAPIRQRVGPRCHCQLPSMFSCGAMAGSVACQTPSW